MFLTHLCYLLKFVLRWSYQAELSFKSGGWGPPHMIWWWRETPLRFLSIPGVAFNEGFDVYCGPIRIFFCDVGCATAKVSQSADQVTVENGASTGREIWFFLHRTAAKHMRNIYNLGELVEIQCCSIHSLNNFIPYVFRILLQMFYTIYLLLCDISCFGF